MDKQNMLSQDTLQSFISDGTSQAVRDRYASLPEIAATMDFGDLDHNVVVLDTETTGFSFNHDELTQIAAARMEQGEIVEWFITFVNPGKPIPEDVAHLTDIHDRDVADAPLPADALAKLVEFIGDAKVVAHNAVGEYLDRFARSCANRASPHEIASLARSCAGFRRAFVDTSRRCRRRGNLRHLPHPACRSRRDAAGACVRDRPYGDS